MSCYAVVIYSKYPHFDFFTPNFYIGIYYYVLKYNEVYFSKTTF